MQIKGKSILVLGGAGFIGTHLVMRLVALGAQKVVVVDNLVHNQHLCVSHPNVSYQIKDARDIALHGSGMEHFDFLFNLAVLSLPHSLKHPERNFDNNVDIVKNILLRMRAGEFTGRFIHFSSSEVYGTAIRAPMDEQHPYFPSTPYAVSKAACDMWIQSIHSIHGMQVAILRPFNNYGPFQNDKTYAGVIPATLARMTKGKGPVIYGTGLQTRDYVFVEDTVDAAIMLAEAEPFPAGQIFNVASCKETSIKDLVLQLRAIYQSLTNTGIGAIEYAPAREADVHRHIGSGYLIEDTLGFKPKISLEHGLIQTVEWYVRRRDGKNSDAL